MIFVLFPEPECITIPVPLRQKVAIPAVPVSAPVYNTGHTVVLAGKMKKAWSKVYVNSQKIIL